MATFCYKHPETGELYEACYPMGKAPRAIEKDGVRWPRCLAAEIAGQGGIQTTGWPLKSRALAVHPTQTKEYEAFAKKHGIPIKFDKQGHPVFETRRQRKQYGELVGAIDYEGGWGDPS